MRCELFGLLLGDGEREKLHELCVREGIPITFPELFDKDAPMKYMWSFNINGIGGAGTIVMRHLKADGIPIIHGVKELEEFFSSEIWAEHKKLYKGK